MITDEGGLTILDAVLPQIVEFAHDRIIQDSDFDFLATRQIDATTRTMRGMRDLSIPTSFVIIEQVALIKPSSDAPDYPNSYTERIPLLRVGAAFLDAVWPQPWRVRKPRQYETYFAVVNQQVTDGRDGSTTGLIRIAPTVDNEYVCEIRGTFNPVRASADNPRTFLLEYYPSLFFSASMAIATGALKQNFGAQADDPRQAISWEQQYSIQKAVALKQSQRMHGFGPGWVSWGPMPMGVLPRFQMAGGPQGGGQGGQGPVG